MWILNTALQVIDFSLYQLPTYYTWVSYVRPFVRRWKAPYLKPEPAVPGQCRMFKKLLHGATVIDILLASVLIWYLLVDGRFWENRKKLD
jgi:hypothetical protein